MTTMARKEESSTSAPVLHVAFELSEKTWKLGFTVGLGQKPRLQQVGAGQLEGVLQQIARAKRRFGLAEDVRVVACYEAGMEGFWLHRWLEAQGIESHVVDSSSIDVSRRRRQAKSDRLDAGALVTKLVQYVAGQRKVWSVVHVPSEEAEDLRHNDREIQRLGDERTALNNQIKGLLKTQGIRGVSTGADFAKLLEELRRWDGTPLGSELRARLLRAWERLQGVRQQIRVAEERRRELLEGESAIARKAQQLMALKSVGECSAWRLAVELFGWRRFSRRHEVAGLTGLAPVARQSGDLHRELGISKAGRGRLRGSLVELAWLWVRYQPESALTRWFLERFAAGGKRRRRIGIVAVARKLVVELWKYTETGALPEGALTKS
jgi:transposase